MSRPAGQLSVAQALAGLAIVLALAAGVVALADALLLPTQTLPPLRGPDPLAPCPAAPLDTGPLDVTSGQLIECPERYDGLLVRYEGEVVGAVLRRGERAWLQLNDDPYALVAGPLPAHRTTLGGNSGMSVSVPIEAAAHVDVVGDHEHLGDRVAVVGEFRRADPADGGAPAIRALEAEVVDPGVPIEHPPSVPRLVAAGVLAALALALGAFALWRARRA